MIQQKILAPAERDRLRLEHLSAQIAELTAALYALMAERDKLLAQSTLRPVSTEDRF